MPKLDKIYTRGGDEGKTSLADGSRVSKADPIISLLGHLDEANSYLGVAACYIGLDRSMIHEIQNGLFDLGAYLSGAKLNVTQGMIDRMESEMDRLLKDQIPLTSFILPGGSEAAAHMHVARAIVRRAETHAVFVMEQEENLDPIVVKYLNRLSDLLFVWARQRNNRGLNDILWVPGRTEE
jgi:cob(I)alamin adenosyltransferase